jgi:hypothetical protein
MASQFLTPHQGLSDGIKEYKQVERRSPPLGFLPLINQRKTPLEDYKTFERVTWDTGKSHAQNKHDIVKMWKNIHQPRIHFSETPLPPSGRHKRTDARFDLPPILQGMTITAPRIVPPPPPQMHKFTFSS